MVQLVKKKLFLTVLVLMAIIGAVLGVRELLLRKDTGKTVAPDMLKEEAGDAMFLSEIEILQGEKGAELWRLAAASARMKDGGGIVEAANPVLTYFMPGENKELVVVAEIGDVDQASSRIRFVDSVSVRYAPNVLKTELLLYEGAARSLICPQGGVFGGQGMSGTAGHVTWSLDDAIIYAKGGVNISWENLPRRTSQR